MSAEFVVRDDLEAVSREAARRVIETAREAVVERGACSIALPGGGSPRPLYRLLATEPGRSAMPWRSIDWYWGDERCVPPDDPESNYRMAYEAMLGPAAVAPDRIHRIAAEIRPPAQAAEAYERTLRERVPGGALDLVLMGVGADGHTASLFPGSAALAERERWVIATEAPAGLATRERITLTYAIFDRARTILVVAVGAAKRDVVRAVMGDPDEAAGRYPVARLAPQGSLTWLVDRESAGD